MVQQVVKFCDSISEWTGRTVSWLVWVAMGFCVFEVITRRIFNAPNIWSYDVIDGFYSVHFMLLGGYALLKHAHVSVDIFSVRFSKKIQSIVQIITYIIFFFPFAIVLFYVGFNTAAASWKVFERTAIGLPLVMPIMKTCLPLAALALFIQGIPELIRYILIVKEDKSYA
ncbi:MAG TPA: TRAP transporter small permease subunit [Smithellaceae bacterium]|nr:TRAP transporter small permease subunit [Smithellaceae bacterium]